MSWVRRHLYFLIGMLATVGVLAGAFVYALGGYMANRRAFMQLRGAFAELKRLCEMDPHPGTEKINNIQIAADQQKDLRAYLQRAAERFVPIPPLPDAPHITTEEFTAQLSRTIDQLQRDASRSGVSLPPRYNFTFESIKRRVTFSTNSLPPLAAQLGEVKAICDILFGARINALDNIRRERVCPEDSPETAPSDYLEQVSVTNELAVLTPYELTFRCFSSELAQVLGGLAASPYSFVIKKVDIGPAAPLGFAPEGIYGPEGYAPATPFGYPPRMPAPEDTFRPGLPGTHAPGMYGPGPYPRGTYAPRLDWVTPPPGATAAPTTPRTGQTPALAESMFRVVLRLDVVKLNLPK